MYDSYHQEDDDSGHVSNGFDSNLDEENPLSFEGSTEENIDFPVSTTPNENIESQEHQLGFEGNGEPNKNQSGSIKNDVNANNLDPSGPAVQPVQPEVKTDLHGTVVQPDMQTDQGGTQVLPEMETDLHGTDVQPDMQKDQGGTASAEQHIEVTHQGGTISDEQHLAVENAETLNNTETDATNNLLNAEEAIPDGIIFVTFV